MSRIDAAAARLVARWTRLYTAGLPAEIRDRRRGELASDVHGQREDARTRGERPAATAALMASRLVRGGWSDLSWRHEAGRPVRIARWQARRRWWAAGAILAALAAGVVWFGAGLALRSGGNRQPLRLAAAAASRLASGSRPAAVLPPMIDMASSPAPFVIVFDAQHHILASSGRLNGQLPVLPASVLAWVDRHGQDRITWQPQPGLREAAVIEPYRGTRQGIVLAAQSLRDISSRQLILAWSIACTWLAALAVAIVAVRLLPGRARPRP
jgi:hypothetical protein